MSRARSCASDEARWWKLEPRARETLRDALERTLRDAILAGSLRAGVRLPASRALARGLGVSRGVVSDAYAQLASQDFLISRTRAAPIVADAARPAVVRTPVDPRPAIRYDLTPRLPDIALFPLRQWLASEHRVAREAGSAVLSYRDPRGERTLREALADHLGRTRGVIADPDEIFVTQGAGQSIDLMLRVLSARGAMRVALEDPSQVVLRKRVLAHGLAYKPQPLDEHGLVVDDLVGDAILVMPAHHFPTGSVLPGERRRRLLAWARATGGLIIENDYASEFRHGGVPARALQGLAADRVALIGTVATTLAPALRLGWLVVPQALVDETANQQQLADDACPALSQLTLAAFLGRGAYDRHLRAARAVYRARRDRLLAAVDRHLPELAVTGYDAGVHLLLRLPTGMDDQAIVDRARQERIEVPALSSFCIESTDQRGLVIGYGAVHEAAIESAIAILATIVRAQFA
ncbi:MAG: PLP-dependent aminotransferase family protein [Solirubrobacteraceae bacterium]